MNKQFDILIIDDEQVITEAVTKICTMEGYKVDASLDAVNALSKLTKKQLQAYHLRHHAAGDGRLPIS